MNVVSATDVDGAPATGEATLGEINGVTCLVLDSETVVKSGPHRANTTAMREMFAMGPSNGSKGVHNEKGIGLRLLQAKLGGKESDAAELIVITVDAQTKIGSIARAGPKVNERYGDGTNLARVVMGFTVDDHGGATICTLDIDGPGQLTPDDIYAERIMCQSEHPFQAGQDNGRTKVQLMEVAAECYDLAKGNTAKCLTRFIYFNLGTTDKPGGQVVPLLKAVEDDITLNDVNDGGLDLSEMIRESYVPTNTGLYPLPGIDDADHTRGLKEFTVQGQIVFNTASFLEEAWANPKSITSGVITIKNPHGAGSLRMVACWPDPEPDKAAVARGDVRPRGGGSDRLRMHGEEAYFTGTYIASKDKIINPWDPKSLNQNYHGALEFNNALKEVSMNSASQVNTGLLGRRGSAYLEWLGFKDWTEYDNYGLPRAGFDKDMQYEMMTCGAIFIWRIDGVAGLDTRKDEMVPLPGTGITEIKEIGYLMRRAEVKWCLENKTQERIAKEKKAAGEKAAKAAQQAQQAAAKQQAAQDAAAQQLLARKKKGRAREQPDVDTPGGRSSRKRKATKAFDPQPGSGGRGGTKKAKKAKAKAPAPEQIDLVTEAVRPVDAFVNTAALSTANIDELRNLVKTAIQKLEQAGFYKRASGAGSSSSAAGPSGPPQRAHSGPPRGMVHSKKGKASAAASMEVVNADDDDDLDERDATPVQGDDDEVYQAKPATDDDSDDLD